MKIVIVGAGLSGLTAAAVLKENGLTDVTLIDKGRSPGGRLATRRIGGGRADHGAQFFTVRTDELKKRTAQWLEAGWIKEWYADPYPRYTGTEGMNSLAKKLAADLDVRTDMKIVRVEEVPGGFQLFSEKGESIQSAAVLLTIPAPQAAELLNASSIPGAKELEEIKFNPCLAALVTVKKTNSIGDHGHLDRSLPDGIERMADQSAKGISPVPITVIYMTGEWSKEHFEMADDEILSLILKKAEAYIGEGNVEAVQLKKWRYAEAVKPYQHPFLDLNQKHPFLIAGDAFLKENDPAGRTRFESAYLSGAAAGEELVRRMRDRI